MEKLTTDKREQFGIFMRRYGILLVLLLLIAVFFTTSPTFRTYQNMMNIMRQVSINGIIAMGLTYVILTGGIDLSGGSLVAVAGVVLGSILTHDPTWIAPAILAAIAVCALFGLLNGFMVAKANIPPFIVTLAAMTMARGFAYVYSDGRPFTLSSEGFRVIGSGYMPMVIFLTVTGILWILLAKTKFGRHTYATGGNLKGARASGVKTVRTIVSVYVMSAVLAGIAGVVLASRINSGQPAVGIGFETDAIAATVIGGTSMTGGNGRISGTLIGVLIIGVLNNGLNLWNVSSYYQQIIKGAIILLAVFFDMRSKKATT